MAFCCCTEDRGLRQHARPADAAVVDFFAEESVGGIEPTPSAIGAFEAVEAGVVEPAREEQFATIACGDLSSEKTAKEAQFATIACGDLSSEKPAKDIDKLQLAQMPSISMQRSTSRPTPRRLMVSNQMDADVSELVSFGGRTDLIRASRLSVVLRRGASILENSSGSAETFDLSEEVERIHAFISHNWDVPRGKKYFCLALQFNLNLAVAAGIAALAVVALAAGLGHRFLVVDTTLVSYLDPTLGAIVHGWGCTLLMAPVVLSVALFGHELQHLAGYRGRMVFLDKTCINQVDKEAQMEAIRKLGAFVRKSAIMVVPYTDLYLTRLWTVYEVACFISVNTSLNLVVVPTSQPLLVFGATAAFYPAMMLRIYLGSISGGLIIPVKAVTYGLGVFVVAVFLRRSFREKETIHRRMASFKVEQCGCLREEDRPLVHQNIAVLMRATGTVDAGATERQALDGFNDTVRSRLSASLTASIGPVGLRYRQAVFIFLSFLSPQWVDIYVLGTLPDKDWNTRFRICWSFYWLAWIFGAFPLCLAILSGLCSKCLHVVKAPERFLLVASTVFILSLGMSVQTISSRLVWAAILPGPYRNACTTGLVLLLPLSVLLAVYIFTCGCQLQHGEEVEEEQEQGAEEEAGDMDPHQQPRRTGVRRPSFKRLCSV